MKFTKRYIVISVMVIVFSLIYILRLYNLQVHNGKYFSEASQKRISANLIDKAPRGQILDRNGTAMVVNSLSYCLQIQKSNLKNGELNACIYNLIEAFEKHNASYLDNLPIAFKEPFSFIYEDEIPKEEPSRTVEKENIWKKKNNFKTSQSAKEILLFYIEKYALTDYPIEKARKIAGVRYEMEKKAFSIAMPFLFSRDIPMEILTTVKEHPDKFPYVNIVNEYVRNYPNGNTASHILGRIGAMSEEEYNKLKGDGYTINDSIGVDGVEKVLEPFLCGIDGTSTISKSSNGKILDVASVQAPIAGNNALLTIDLQLQKVTETALKQAIENIAETGRQSLDKNGSDATSGAAIVMNVKTGEILASASFPTYYNASFNADYSALLRDNNKPLVNRPLAGTYEPGSTFKMLTGIAALETGNLAPNEKIYDKGKYVKYRGYSPSCLVYKRYGRTHGNIDLAEALKVSCNYFFYEIGDRTGIQELNKYAKMFGLGEKTGIELNFQESKGRLAGIEDREKNHTVWNPGDTLQSSIGQSDNLFTPLQIVNYISTIANGGTRFTPYIVKDIQTADGKLINEFTPKVAENVSVSKESLEFVKKGMGQVAEMGGTAYKYFADMPIKIAAKTGSTQVPNGSDNSIFTAFAPYDNPEIAVCIIIEHGHEGNKSAPIAVDIFNEYFGFAKE